ncbi:GntR family transcriptional regulator [Pelagibius sp. Alg239-R121]|uniref:GntR family transcriptional regulator n=1 Tax=Pelagibius sp. Alg239-R121 TaxID=2993448 RepID=UPI0024A689C5|nr:GntR family transcriptional regulator [Pelagibius sp. Alg239-R121]
MTAARKSGTADRDDAKSASVEDLRPNGDAKASEAEIIERIYAAVMEQRLPPGTKLSEATLSETFGASRMRIRRVLLVLASREIVQLHSNRGAYISKPSASEARSIFEARRTIEPVIIRNAVERVTPAELATLEKHMAEEHKAHHQRNRRDAIRLSGEFHVKLAALGDNPVLERYVKELVMRTSLIIGLFGAPGIPNCSDHEHSELLDAIRAGDGNAAAEMMMRHLSHIEEELELTGSHSGKVNIKDIFGS